MTERCYRCGKVLDPDRIKWLELNCHTGEWRTEAHPVPWPEDQSQGYFAFGPDCAPKQLEKPRDAHPNWFKSED